MKVVILAGGLGSRLSEYTKTIPKPMINIKGKPLIYYIMKHYAKYGFKEFYIALGYKGEIIKKYFKKNSFGWKVNMVNTGLKTMTGGRLKRLKKYLNNETFMLTYGDGLSNVNIKKLIELHNRSKKIATLTAVLPPARFGVLKIKGKKITSFKEKIQLKNNWINGGFFVFNSKIFDFITGDKIMLEREPFQKLTKKGQLLAYKHYGFWQCMDTMRDKKVLNKLLRENKAPWIKKK
jgi:glucose-1-phosphate cytidylyltransferase